MNLSDQIKKSKINIKKVSDLIPYARNARKHDEWQVQQIAGSIKEYGFTNPVLIDETNEIIAGHGRVLAANKLGIQEVSCIVLGYLTPIQKKAYALADNKIALNSSWDEMLLKLEIEELNQNDDFDFTSIGFTDLEIAALLPDEQEFVAPEDKEDEWEGMPEFNQKDATSFRHIIVHFDNQEHVDQFAALIDQNLTDKTKSIWFPPQEKMDTESKRYG